MSLFSWSRLAQLRDRAFSAEKSLEAETTRANVAAHRIQELESDLLTLQGQHANTQEANRVIVFERDAAMRELKVRSDLILQHGRTIAEIQAQNERLLRDNKSAVTTAKAAVANATASQAKCEELLARGETLTKERDAAQKAHADAEKRIGHLEDQLKRAQGEVATLRATQARLFDGLQRLLNEAT